MAKKISSSDYYNSFESRLGYQVVLGGTKHFGLFGPEDSRWNFGAGMRRMEDLLGQTLALPKSALVLDAGCGVGDVARRLATRHRYHVTGVDILPANISEAKRRAAADNVSSATDFHLMSYDELDFDADTFDGVFTMETLVHAKDPGHTLAGFYRILKDGGRLALFEYSYDSEIPAGQRAILRKVNDLAAMPGFEVFHDDALEGMLTTAGFRDVTSTEITDQVAPMVRSFAEMAAGPYALLQALGLGTASVNLMSAVEFWGMRRYLHYRVYVGVK